ALVAERLAQRLSERDPDILDGMVRVDVQIALRGDREIEHAVARDLIEHVIEKGDARRKRGLSGAVDVDAYVDVRLGRAARDLRASDRTCVRRIHRCRSVRCRPSTSTSASFSSGVPTVMRRQLASSGCEPCRFFTRILAERSASNDASASGTRTSTKLVLAGNVCAPAFASAP